MAIIQWHRRCHFVPFAIHISGAKFEDNTALIFLEIFLFQYFTIFVAQFITSSLS